jgi:hypothetical protein
MAADNSPGNYTHEGSYGPYFSAGAPAAGTNAVQTLTLDATGGTFQLAYEGRRTAAITWSATNATLLANIQAALDALLGTNAVVATAGTLTAGVGTVLLTFSGAPLSKTVASVFTVANNSLTGTATCSIANTTPGVRAAARNAKPGARLVDVSAGKAYINTGTQGAPTWTVEGTQS